MIPPCCASASTKRQGASLANALPAAEPVAALANETARARA